MGILATCTLALSAVAQPPEPLQSGSVAQPSPTPSSTESSSRSATTASTSSALTSEVPVVPQGKIFINETSEEGDDLVLWSGSNLGNTDTTTKCAIFLDNAASYGDGETVTIVLTNSDNHISFSNQDADGHLTFALSSSNDQSNPQFFYISGSVRNTKVNDTVINAHQNYATAGIVGSEDLTVYWFGEDKVSLEAKSGYVLFAQTSFGQTSYSYAPSGGPAVEMRAQSVAKPLGIDMEAPQLKKWRVGIVQNVTSAAYSMRCANPFVLFKKDPSASFVVSKVRSKVANILSRENDFSRRPGAGPFTPPLYLSDDMALKTPRPTNVAVTSDAPDIEDVNPVVQRFGSDGNLDVSYTYGSAAGYINEKFDTYSVLVDTARSESNVYPRRRTGWTLNVSSATIGKAVVNSTDGPYQNDANLSKTQAANDVLIQSQHFDDSATTVVIQ